MVMGMAITEIMVAREDEKATAILRAIRHIDDGEELVPVVRCKDCKHLRTHKRCYTCPKRVGALPDDLMGFCSHGEKEEEKGHG